MSCKEGDSIRAGSIPSYTSLFERQDFDTLREYELSELDAQSLYSELSDKMQRISFNDINSSLTWQTENPNQGYLSILIQRNSQCDYVHPDVQIARLGALIQNILILHYGNMKYIKFLTKRMRSNITKISKGYLKPYYSGYYVQDIQCSYYDDLNEIQSLLNSNIKFLNNQMESCKVINISLTQDSTYSIKPSDSNLMIGILDRDIFKDFVERYTEWYSLSLDEVEIQEQDIRASIHLMLDKKKYPKRNISIKIAQKADKWVVGMYLPIGISPYLILKTLYPKVKLNEIYHHSSFIITDIYRDLNKIDSKVVSKDSRVCSCGSELVYDLINKRTSKVCQGCRMLQLMNYYISN